MDSLKSKVLATVSRRLQARGMLDFDVTAEETVDEVEAAILNYCNLNAVPSALMYVWVNMTFDYCLWLLNRFPKNTNASKQNTSTTPTMLTSLREGDVTLGFSADTNSVEYQSATAHNPSGMLDRVVMNYVDQLNAFRRVVW